MSTGAAEGVTSFREAGGWGATGVVGRLPSAGRRAVCPREPVGLLRRDDGGLSVGRSDLIIKSAKIKNDKRRCWRRSRRMGVSTACWHGRPAGQLSSAHRRLQQRARSWARHPPRSVLSIRSKEIKGRSIYSRKRDANEIFNKMAEYGTRVGDGALSIY